MVINLTPNRENPEIADVDLIHRELEEIKDAIQAVMEAADYLLSNTDNDPLIAQIKEDSEKILDNAELFSKTYVKKDWSYMQYIRFITLNDVVVNPINEEEFNRKYR